MKKILVFIGLLICICSCNDAEVSRLNLENETLKANIVKLETEIKDIQAKLDNCILGNPQKDIVKIGRWKDMRPGTEDNVMTIFRNIKTNKTYMKDSFGDGSETTEEVRVSTYNGLKRYDSIENDHHEFYVINEDGNLNMYSQGGLFGVALSF